jgi:hypothetical protein
MATVFDEPLRLELYLRVLPQSPAEDTTTNDQRNYVVDPNHVAARRTAPPLLITPVLLI